MQDILIRVRTCGLHTPALQFGVRLAAQLGAAVTAVYACPEPRYVAPAFHPEVMAALLQNTDELLREGVAARQAFLEWAARLKVAAADWLVARGPVAASLAEAAARHDLLILDHAESDRDTAGDLPGLVLRVRRPCIVVPLQGGQFEKFQRVAIAWNGSPEAMRAVHAALPLLGDAKVLLLRGEERPGRGPVDWHPPFEIGQYLRGLGLDVTQHAIEAKPDAAGAALLEEAMRFGAQLLVMGAYGRHRFSEWALGGATGDVLALARIPVLMRH
ncbi:MAG: universal stress protein [Rhodanobacteraceae bacterium]|nr:MAG: universal stress protein [Rhodanobacteraceae bacterium]